MLDIKHKMLDILASNILSTRILVELIICRNFKFSDKVCLELYVLAPIAAASFFLHWLEKSAGKKRYSGKREIASNNIII